MRFFKVMISEYEALPDDPINCPYCGYGTDTGEFMTEEQRSRVAAGAEAVLNLCNEVLGEGDASVASPVK